MRTEAEDEKLEVSDRIRIYYGGRFPIQGGAKFKMFRHINRKAHI